MEFRKYQKIRALGHAENRDIFANENHKIFIQEKLDGANFRFYITKDNQVIFGSRTQQLTSNEGEDTNVEKNFRRCVEFVRERVKDNPLLALGSGLIFYGECMVKHTMEYDWENIPPFLGFDVYDTEAQQYLYPDSVEEAFDILGLEVAPYIKVTTAGEIKEFTDKDVPVSKWAPKSNPKQQAEGVVFKNYDYSDKYGNEYMFAKYVRAKFKEENSLTFGGSPKYSEDDTGKLVLKWCTNARIDKQIFKLVDEGHELDMPMMAHLSKRVTHDIWEEEWETIIGQNWNLDLKKMRKQITRRCLMVLKQVITNNALGGKDGQTEV